MSKQLEFETASLETLTKEMESRLSGHPPTALLRQVSLKNMLTHNKYESGKLVETILERSYSNFKTEIHRFLKVLLNIQGEKVNLSHLSKFENLIMDMTLGMAVSKGLQKSNGGMYLFSRAVVISDVIKQLMLYADLQSFKQQKYYMFESLRERLAKNHTNTTVNRLLLKHVKDNDEGLLFPDELIEFFKAVVSVMLSNLVAYTPYFSYKVIDSRKHMRLNQEAIDVIEKDKSYKIKSIKHSMPFVEPPQDWYWEDDKGIIGLYKHPALLSTSAFLNTKSYMLAQGEEAFKPYIAFANRMQKQPWAINNTIYNLISSMDDHFINNNSQDFFGIQNLQTINEDDTSHIKVHKITSNKKRVSKLISLHGAIDDINELNNYMDEYLYFAYKIDSRGRLYPIARYLSPQGTGFVKALLKFGKPCILNEEGVVSLKQYLAKLFGFEKMATKARLEAFENISNQIVEIGMLVNQGRLDIPYPELWKGKDAMICFANAAAWAEIYTNPVGKPWYLPVTIDGTCNGIQHIAAITRDAELASYVNVLDAYDDTPADIYGMCMELTKEDLKQRAKHEDMAKFWLEREHQLTRKLAKSAVMVTPYNASSGTKAGTITQAMSIEIPDFKDIDKDTRIYLRDRILAATLKVTASAVNNYSSAVREGIGDYKLDIKNRHDIPHIYTTPLGLRVYPKIDTVTNVKEIAMFGHRYWLSYYTTLIPLNKGVLVNQTCPNIIHSYDSTHMIMSMNELLKSTDANVWLIHDEFGTDPNSLNELQSIIRYKFVYLHKNYPLDRLLNKELKINYQVNTLNLEDIMKSKFLFN